MSSCVLGPVNPNGSATLNYVNEGQMTKIQGRIGEDHCDRHPASGREQELCEHCATGWQYRIDEKRLPFPADVARAGNGQKLRVNCSRSGVGDWGVGGVFKGHPLPSIGLFDEFAKRGIV